MKDSKAWVWMPDYTWERWGRDRISECFHNLYFAVDFKTGIIRYAHTLDQQNELYKYFFEDFHWRLWKFKQPTNRPTN